MDKKRYLQSAIQKDALQKNKMVFISGSRQVGKTTLGKQFLEDKKNYFSWDQTEFRKTWAKFPEKILDHIGNGPILIDEVHKDKIWKRKIKGLYDRYHDELDIIVTGSAKLDIYRKGGDSLMGRYVPYRLHPFTVGESINPPSPDQIFKKPRVSYPWKDLMNLGGYPEPLLRGRLSEAERWSRLRLDQIAYEEIRDIKMISQTHRLRLLLDLIPEKIGSLFSYNSLKEDVGVAYATVRDWVLLLSQVYYGFFIKPYSKSLKRSNRSNPKFYVYDILQIPKKEQRLENLTALHLIKACHYWTDTAQGVFDLYFLKDKEKREVDFLITRNKTPWMLVECKSQSKNLSPHLIYYKEQLKTPLNFQLVETKNYDKKHRIQNIRIMEYEKFFSGLV